MTAENIVDETTANWPIPPDMSDDDDMRNLMRTHMALPLPVYKGDSYIDPARVNAAIKGGAELLIRSLVSYNKSSF
jgi:hypothetical protein